MKFDRLIQEIYLNANLYSGKTDSTGLAFHPLPEEIRGKKITEIKGCDVFLRQGNAYSLSSPDKNTDISVWKDDKNLLTISLRPYGLPNQYVENMIASFVPNLPIKAYSLYEYIILKLGFIIHSDTIHSEKGAGVWKRLMENPNIQFSFLDPQNRKWTPINPKDEQQIKNLWTTDPKHEASGIRIKAQKK
jgi:hypothetical protein